MRLKDFIDISTKAGCKIGKKQLARPDIDEYTVEYDGKVYATGTWNDLDKTIYVTFRDTYLKWYQQIIAYQYGFVTTRDDYIKKLAKVINQNKEK